MKLIKTHFALFTIFIGSSFCHAGEVYKYTDENGNIIYSDSKPNDNVKSESIKLPEPANQFDSQNSNQKAMQKLLDQQAVRDNEESAKQSKQKENRQTASKALKAAKQALTDAKVIRDGDMFPLPGGGVRYSDQYKDRVSAAEKALDEAQAIYNKTK